MHLKVTVYYSSPAETVGILPPYPSRQLESLGLDLSPMHQSLKKSFDPMEIDRDLAVTPRSIVPQDIFSPLSPPPLVDGLVFRKEIVF